MGIKGLFKSLMWSYGNGLKTISFRVSGNCLMRIYNSEIELSQDSTLEIGLEDRKHSSHPFFQKSKLRIVENSKLRIKEGFVSIGSGSVIDISSEGLLQIGANSYINGRATIICEEEIRIGKNVKMAWDITIMDTDRHDLENNGKVVNKDEKVVIEDDVWVGHDVNIKKGVTIGENSVVASGSTVTKSIPPNSLAAGSPAKIRREL